MRGRVVDAGASMAGMADADGAGDVETLATNGPQLRRQRKLFLPVYGAMAVVYGAAAVLDHDAFMTVAAGLIGLGVAFIVLAAHYLEPASITLVGTTLEYRRPLRSPLRVERADVVAVRGSIPFHPSWSDRVVVETTNRTVTLPRFSASPATLIGRLQEWAGVGETPVAVNQPDGHAREAAP